MTHVSPFDLINDISLALYYIAYISLVRCHVRIYNDPLANQNAWKCLGITR